MDFLKQTDGDLNKLGAQPRDGFDAELGSDGNFVTTASREKTVKNGTILLVAVFCVSLVCLWFMVKKTTPQTAAAKTDTNDMQIETAIAKVIGTKAEFFKGIDNVVNKFDEFSGVMQVKVGELKKNPFELQKYESVEMNAVEDFGASAAERERSLRLALEKEATGMQLLSIMKSPSGNTCMINDKILSKGEKIDGWEVKLITDKTVELRAGGMQKTLKISE
jgi:preprotein translocase subunit SecG